MSRPNQPPRSQLPLVEVFDCTAGVAATAVAVTDLLVVEWVVVPVVAGVTVLVAAVVVDAPVVADFVVATMQPVSPIMLAMLRAPAILRARRAGCGRGRRGVGGLVVVMAAPFDRKQHDHRAGR
jgi:hypothetical protein